MARTEYDPLPAWCAGDEWCPITATAAVLGKKWHPVIIHRLIRHGPLRFNNLKEEIDGVSGKVLSESLDDLQEKQLVERRMIDDQPPGTEYSLTAYGEALEPVIEDMYDWGTTYLTDTEDRAESIV